jgi:hypothetical protein
MSKFQNADDILKKRKEELNKRNNQPSYKNADDILYGRGKPYDKPLDAWAGAEVQADPVKQAKRNELLKKLAPSHTQNTLPVQSTPKVTPSPTVKPTVTPRPTATPTPLNTVKPVTNSGKKKENKPSWWKSIVGGLAKGFTGLGKNVTDLGNMAIDVREAIEPQWMKNADNKIVEAIPGYERFAEHNKQGVSNASKSLGSAMESIDKWDAYDKQTGEQKFMGDTIGSIPQMATMFVPGAGPALFAATAGAGYADDMKQRGGNLGQQLAYGVIGGAAEVTLNKALDILPGYKKFFNDAFEKRAIAKLSSNGFKELGTLAKDFGKQMGKEAIEEGAIDPVMNLADMAITGNKRPLATWGESDPNKQGIFDAKQMSYDMLAGAVMAGLVDAPALAKHSANIVQAKKYIETNYPEVLAYADALPQNTTSFRIAQALKQLDTNVTVNDVQNLAQQVQNDYQALSEDGSNAPNMGTKNGVNSFQTNGLGGRVQYNPNAQQQPGNVEHSQAEEGGLLEKLRQLNNLRDNAAEQHPGNNPGNTFNINDLASRYQNNPSPDATNEVEAWREALKKRFSTPNPQNDVQTPQNLSQNQRNEVQPTKDITGPVEASNGLKIALKNFGPVEVVDASDRSLVEIKTKNGTVLKIGKEAFKNLQEPGQKVEYSPTTKSETSKTITDEDLDLRVQDLEEQISELESDPEADQNEIRQARKDLERVKKVIAQRKAAQPEKKNEGQNNGGAIKNDGQQAENDGKGNKENGNTEDAAGSNEEKTNDDGSGSNAKNDEGQVIDNSPREYQDRLDFLKRYLGHETKDPTIAEALRGPE